MFNFLARIGTLQVFVAVRLLPEEFAHGTRLKAAMLCYQQGDWCSSLHRYELRLCVCNSCS